MKHLSCLLFIALFSGVLEFDGYVGIDGLWYKFKGNQVRVVSRKTDQPYPADIVIPDTITYKDAKYPVTSIGPRAFQYDETIKSVTIPQTVGKIEGSSFYGCTGLEKVVIPPSITIIEESAFYRCTNLKSINIPASVKKIGDRAFSPAGFEAITVEPGNAFYDSRGGCNAIIETASNTLMYGSASTVIPPTVTAIAPMAFEGICGLKSIEIPASVTEIGNAVFRGCTSLESIVIPETVQRIGLRCFEGSGLKHAVINGNVEFVSFGFIRSDSLQTMTFGPGVTTLYFPQDCPNLKSIHIPANVKEIRIQDVKNLNLESITVDEANPYYDSRDNCNAIIETATDRLILACSNTVIPNTVKMIDGYAFTGGLMKELHIPASVEYIHEYAFDTELSIGGNNRLDYRGALTRITVDPANPVYDSRDNCNAIIHKPSNTLLWAFNTTVIPQSVTNIWEHAFMALTDLKEITIPDAVRSISFRAFFNCSNLEKITIGAGVTEMSPYAFQDSNGNLTEIKVNPANKTYDSRNDCNAIIETATGTLLLGSAGTVVPDGVTAIGEYAFQNNRKLVSVTLPPSVKTIDDYAFSGCSNLEEINLENVTRKGESAFSGCAFNSYRYVNEINGYLSFRIIGKEAVLNHVRDNAPSDITIPESFSYEGKEYTVTEIVDNAFSSNTDIISVTVPSTVRSIGSNAFDGCTSLRKVVLNEGLKSIGDDAFANCSALKEIKLPSTLEYIGRSAFTRSAIRALVIPASVTEMGRNITLDCKNLKSMSVNPGNRTFDSRGKCNAIIRTDNNLLLEGCCKTRIPKDVTAIAPYAFAGTTGLKSIDIPQSVKYIFDHAFAFCDLEKIVIPESVTLLDGSPFMGCGKLKSITVQKGNPSYASIPGCNAIISKGNDNRVVRSGELSALWVSVGYRQGTERYWSREAGTLVQGCRNTVIPQDAVVVIGYNAFAFCKGLEKIVIPESVTTVQSTAFLHCDDLKELHLSASVTDFSKSDYCGKLEKITVAPENPVYYSPEGSNAVIEKKGDILIMGCKGTVIPNTVKMISQHSFEHVRGLKSVIIPNSVEVICGYAFNDCADLESVSIPASVTYMGRSSWNEPDEFRTADMQNPFNYCPLLKHITVDSGNPVFDSREDCNAVIIKSLTTMLVASGHTIVPESVNNTHREAYTTLETYRWEPDYLSTWYVFPDGRMVHSYIAGDDDD
jgi:hypothetical protein